MRAKLAIALSIALPSALGLIAFPTRAAEVAGARLTLTRSAEAADCPDETAIATELSSRIAGVSEKSERPTAVEIKLIREGNTFVAAMRAEGRSAGVRILKAAGPLCAALHEALLISLVVLFDENATPASTFASRPRPQVPTATPPSPPTAVTAYRPPMPPTEANERPASTSMVHPQLWISAGGAVTHGLPFDFSAALLGDLVLRVDRLDLAAGGFWSPKRPVSNGQGDIQIRAYGGRARACYAALLLEPKLRASGCALGALLALRGEGVHVDTSETQNRPWGLVGAGADVELRLSDRLALGLEGSMLVSVHRETFYIAGTPAPTIFETDWAVGSIGADLLLRIW